MLVGIDASRAIRPRPTGTETYARRIIVELLALGASHDYRLYFDRPPGPDLFAAAEQRVISFPRLWTQVRLSLELAVHRPDLLFVPAHVLPLYRSCPSVVTVMDLGYLHFPRAHPLGQRLYLDWTNRFHARVATRLLAISEHTKRQLVARYGVPAERVVVTPLAAEAPADGQAPTEPPEAPYVLAVGTVHPRKNLGLLIRAFGPLARAHPQARLLIAGRLGWLYEGILAEVEQRHLGGRVTFLGYVERERLWQLLREARIFAFPSLYEGFGLPILEAQLAGAPVLASQSSSIPEVAGEGAVLLDPEDEEAWAEALVRLWENGALRADLARRGRSNAARFSWARTARLTLGALQAAGG